MKPRQLMPASLAAALALSYFMPRARSPRLRDSLNPDVQAARERGWTDAQFETLWRQYEALQLETCRQIVQVELLKFQRPHA